MKDCCKLALPKYWNHNLQAAVLHVISLAHLAIIYARGWAANSINARVRLQAKLEEAENKILLLQEELQIKDSRFSRIEIKNRPRFSSEERMQILQLRAVKAGQKLKQPGDLEFVKTPLQAGLKGLMTGRDFYRLAILPQISSRNSSR